MECSVCQTVCETKCSRCKEVVYCSVAHQKEHWPIHQYECGPFRVVDSKDRVRGKYCIANRDLKAGEIILEEPAAFYSTWFMQPRACVSCGEGVTGTVRETTCTNCGCTVCGPTCQEDPVHAKNECPMFAKNKKISTIFKRFTVDPSPMFLMIRGAALKGQKPHVFKELMQLQHTSRSELFQKKIDSSIGRFFSNLKQAVGSSAMLFDDDVYKRMGSVAFINMFRDITRVSSPLLDLKIQGNTDRENNAMDEGISKGRCCVYMRASRLNHSCIPNCSYVIGPEPECRIRVYASVPISKGEEITICYAGGQINLITYGTHERRKLLEKDCGIHCKCLRCTDPTELGSYSSAVTCMSCMDRLNDEGEEDCTKYGYMMAENPLDDSAEAVWKCNSCDEFLDNFTIQGFVKATEKELTAVPSTPPKPGSGVSRERIELRLFDHKMKNCRGSKLHPNHFLIAKTVGAIVSSLECEIVSKNAPPLRVIERHLGWINYLLAISDKIYPGFSSLRAQQLSILADILQAKINYYGSDLTEEELSKDYNLYLKTASETFLFHKLQFCNSGRQLNDTARDILLNLNNMRTRWGKDIPVEDDDIKDILNLSKQFAKFQI